MNYNAIKVSPDSEDARVLIITMDRPPVNAMSLEMAREMLDFFRGLQSDKTVRAVVLTGAGDRAFSAGADVKEINERTVEISIERSVVFRSTFDAIRRCPVPTIAAVNGFAIGAGMVNASCCDIVLAAEGAKFALPEILVGVMGGARHTARFMPEKLMRFLAFTGEKIDASELCNLGEVREVLPRDRLMPRALELARTMATRSPSAMRLMKEAINLTEDMPVTEGYRVEQLFTGMASVMSDAKEASRAFLEKRQPNFD
jgi:enoyl-CoA hydratase/carnithine racemase